jgi:3-methyl-2-oxobutanoate hydroxymethyltransferase
MSTPLARKFTVSDLRAARQSGAKVPMLTCYDFTTARLMQEAGVPMLLVGDSAANVVLGYETTLPVSLGFMVEITKAVRRGAPLALVAADMPFGSYHGSIARAVRNVCRTVQLSGADCVKLEAAESQLPAIRQLADAGVAVIAHLGLRPQAVGVLGGYRFQGRTADEASDIVALAGRMEAAGAAAVLLEAVPPEVAQAVVDAVDVPVIGCGAGPACHAHVVVTHDTMRLTSRPPRFAPQVGDVAGPMREALAEYVRRVTDGTYPAPEHAYVMPPAERERFLERQEPPAAAGRRSQPSAAVPQE